MQVRESGGQLPIEKIGEKILPMLHKTQNIPTLLPAEAPRSVGHFLKSMVKAGFNQF